MTKPAANQLWGGRYAGGPSAIMAEINSSIGCDQRLAMQDIQGSMAHAAMLAQQGIITAGDAEKIISGLREIQQQISAGQFNFDPALEDVHMNIEARLTEKIGAAGGRLHTARSRNDQVATDFRLWVRQACIDTIAALRELQLALLDRAAENIATVMPGFTHLQPAQPVSFAHHLLAYVAMLGRDRDRLNAALLRLDESPLGAAALAGTSFPIDRQATAQALGFAQPMANSLDAVADRDFAVDYLAAAALIAVHLSRLAEEIILWVTPQFGFISLSDALTTGSSIMPQKRNPDAAELVRGKTGRIFGNLLALLTTLKALPLAYNKDMQEDKPPVFDSYDTLALCLAATTAMVRDLTVHQEKMATAASSGYTTATEIADWLVQTHQLPFREAHHITGQIVRLAEARACRLDELSLAELQAIAPQLDAGVYGVLSVEAAMNRRNSYGGTAPDQVRAALAAAKARVMA